MDKLKALLQRLGIELTADQTKQIDEVMSKEFISSEAAAADKIRLEELTKQLAARDKDLEKLKADNKSEELQKQLNELNAKYKQDTDDLNAKLSAQKAYFAAEKLFGGYKFASERVKSSVLAEFKSKGFKIDAQERAIRKYAEENDIEIVKESTSTVPEPARIPTVRNSSECLTIRDVGCLTW